MENLTIFFCICFILQIVTNLIILKRFLFLNKKRRHKIDLSKFIVPDRTEETENEHI